MEKEISVADNADPAAPPAATTTTTPARLHPDQGPLEYLKLVGSNRVATYRLFQCEYKWWTSSLSKKLRRGKGEVRVGRYPFRKGVSDNDDELEEALHGMVNYLSPQTLDACDALKAAFIGTIYLTKPLNAEGQYTD